MEQVKVYLQMDCYGTYFVWGLSFFNKIMGDIPASKPYTKREIEFKKIEEGRIGNYKLLELKRLINTKAKKLNFNSIIQIENRL